MDAYKHGRYLSGLFGGAYSFTSATLSLSHSQVLSSDCFKYLSLRAVLANGCHSIQQSLWTMINKIIITAFSYISIRSKSTRRERCTADLVLRRDYILDMPCAFFPCPISHYEHRYSEKCVSSLILLFYRMRRSEWCRMPDDGNKCVWR